MFIAVDDTDSREGMCTTFLATELIREFDDYSLLDHPRLVRLNPNVPWKTRGNGAIVLTLGEGKERDKKIGESGGEIWTYHGNHVMGEEAFSRAEKVIERLSHFQASHTNPGLIVSENRTPEYLYERAVKGIVELEEIMEILEGENYRFRGYGEKRGLIGASAALAWRPQDFTYELLSYRREDMWGKPREIEDSSVIKLDKELKNSFDSYDHELNKQTIAPTSPCPVLYGVRGDEHDELRKAIDIVEGESPERWVTFLTNQATDDHIQKKDLCETEPWDSVRITGEVTSEPRSIEGGHVLFKIDDRTDEMTAAAYEPTKHFRDVVNKLIEGDLVELYGGIRKDPPTLNIEKMRVIDLEDKIVKVSNPECPECGKNMSSMGKNAGYRCKRCRIKADEDQAERERVEREISEGWYEVPVSARRHLSKPLKRMD